MFLTRISVTHPVFATMMMVAIVVLGLFSWQRLGLDQYPNVDVPVVVVVTSYPGATPETVETEVTRPIEDALNAVSGLNRVTSTSYDGRSVVIAHFDLEVQSAAAAQDIRDRVAPLEARFPQAVGKPLVQRFNPADQPIISIAARSPTLDLPGLTEIVDRRVLPELGTVPGVGQATLVGGQKKQVSIEVDETRLHALGVGVDEVLASIRSGNVNTPAGSVPSGRTETAIQVEGRIKVPADFLDMVVARRGGSPVYLRDVARVGETAEDASSRAIYNGDLALAVSIIKNQDANTVAVADTVKAKIAVLNGLLAADGVSLEIVSDGSVAIQESVDQVQATLLEGAFLAVAIVFLFLNSWRSTVITGLTLPISMIGTLAVIGMLGFTLNTMTLLALTLSIGILIDDAIVVRENITRHLHMGKSHFRAALDGTNEIGLAVSATTATIIAVFLPVAFMDGIIGRFFFEFGVTVSAAVLISLFVSFTLDPMLSSVWYDPDAQPGVKRGPMGRIVAKFDHGFDHLVHGYRHVISWTLRHRLVTLLATVGVFVGSVMLTPFVGAEFVPAADTGRMQVNVTAPVGSSLDYTSAKLAQVESALREFPEVRTVYSTVNTGRTTGKHKASVLVELVPHETRTRSTLELAVPVRDRLARIAGIDAVVVQEGFGGGQSPIQVSVLGDDQAVLDRIALELAAAMRTNPGLVDVATSAEEPSSVLSLRIRPEQASDLGIGINQVASTLSTLIGGEEVTNWTAPDGQTRRVVLRLPETARADVDAVAGLMVSTGRADKAGNPVMVRVDQVVDFEMMTTASEIRRLNRSREVLVSGDVSGINLGDATQFVQEAISGLDVPPGYRIQFGGQAENMAETVGHMAMALTMAVIFIYIVLASQFGSFMQPVAIMAALPLSLVGVLAGLMAAGSTINMFSMIGFIMLMGLVTKNGILLVDFVNQERKRGLQLHDALVSAGSIRFRPIIMTTLAMICGMIPLALAMSGGGTQRAPMAHAVIGGLVSSTVLTLLVVPVILSYIDSVTRRLSRFLPKAPDEGHADGA